MLPDALAEPRWRVRDGAFYLRWLELADAAAWSVLDLSRLGPEQRRAVMAPDGPLVMVAGPGSGKTTVLAARIAYWSWPGRSRRPACWR